MWRCRRRTSRDRCSARVSLTSQFLTSVQRPGNGPSWRGESVRSHLLETACDRLSLVVAFDPVVCPRTNVVASSSRRSAALMGGLTSPATAMCTQFEPAAVLIPPVATGPISEKTGAALVLLLALSHWFGGSERGRRVYARSRWSGGAVGDQNQNGSWWMLVAGGR